MAQRKRYLPDSFNERLMDLWLASGLTQEQVAERIGVERKAVNGWLLGKTSPNLMSFMILCRLFHVSADWLLFGEEEKHGGQKSDLKAAEDIADGNQSRM